MLLGKHHPPISLIVKFIEQPQQHHETLSQKSKSSLAWV